MEGKENLMNISSSSCINVHAGWKGICCRVCLLFLGDRDSVAIRLTFIKVNSAHLH